MKKIFIKIEKIKQNLKNFFLSDDKEPDIVRKKHLRLGLLVTTLFLIACYFIQSSGNAIQNLKSIERSKEKTKEELKTSSALDSLNNGTSNELLWTEIQGQAIDELKTQQQTNETTQKTINDKLNSEKVSNQDMDDSISELGYVVTR